MPVINGTQFDFRIVDQITYSINDIASGSWGKGIKKAGRMYLPALHYA